VDIYNSFCFGGLWEASIQSVKYHLRKTFGDKTVTSVEFLTLLSQTEACRNSQPLTVYSSKPHDLNELSTGHFLIGETLMQIPNTNLTDLNINRLIILPQINHWSQDYPQDSACVWNSDQEKSCCNGWINSSSPVAAGHHSTDVPRAWWACMTDKGHLKVHLCALSWSYVHLHCIKSSEL